MTADVGTLPFVTAKLEAVARELGCNVRTLKMRSKLPEVVEVRRRAIVILHKRHGWGVARIGRALGRDHTTIMHHLQVAQERGEQADGRG